MSEQYEFPELNNHPEFAEVDINETIPATGRTIKDLNDTAAELVALKNVKNTRKTYSYCGREGDAHYGVSSYSPDDVPTKLVMSVDVNTCSDGGVLSDITTKYFIFQRQVLEIEKKVQVGQTPDFGSIEDPDAVAKFKEWLVRNQQAEDEMRVLGLLDVNEKEATRLLNILRGFVSKESDGENYHVRNI